MEEVYSAEDIKERLIIAGIRELETHGLNDFSLRRVAMVCEVSCAAPYRHFRSKDELILEIIRYIRHQWSLLRDDLFRLFCEDARRQLIEVALAYVRFFASNPHFRTVLVAAGEDDAHADLSLPFMRYADLRGYGEAERRDRLYSLRATLYGMTAMLENGELAGTAEEYSMIRAAIERVLT